MDEIKYSTTTSSSNEEAQGLDDVEDTELTLVSFEETKFKIDRNAAMQSKLIKTMWEGDKEETEIPLPNVNGGILKKIVDYMTHHTQHPAGSIKKPLESANMSKIASDWDARFIDVDQNTLFELILAANYMDIQSLLDLACAKVAIMINGKTPEEIRKMFNIQNDFTPEEEAAIYAENKWAVEN